MEIFSNTAHKGSPTNFSGTARQKFFYRKSWFSPLRHKIFRHPKLSETQKGSCSKFFGTMRQKFSKGKSWYPLAAITEISGGIDVCKNSLKTKIKTVVLFFVFNRLQKLIKIFVVGREICRCKPTVLFRFFHRQINGELFLAAYVICKKINSFNRVVFLLFSVKNRRLFLFKNKWQQWG